MTRESRDRRLPNALIGVLVVIVAACATYLAFTKELPFGDPYEIRATFANASNTRPSAPVRIAGVEVGEVTEVEHVEGSDDGAAVLTMELSEQALPLKSDATLKLRPRLFLEGNVFVDLDPGSPNAAEVGEGHTFGIERTSTHVQLDQVLTTLQGSVRSELQIFLAELGSALTERGGAEGLRRFYGSSAGAFRATAQVAQASLGQNPHDLSLLVRDLGFVMRGLGRSPAALGGLVTNLRIVAGSLAAESVALERSIGLLPSVIEAGTPVLAQLSDALPPVRALAREALPGVRGATPALAAATPWARQLRALMSPAELRGLTGDLRPAIPDLARVVEATPAFLDGARALSSCFNEVVIPWSRDRVSDPLSPATGNPFEELGYGLVGVAGESRSHDANGPYIRALAGTGANLVEFPPALGRPEEVFGLTPYPLLGAVPAIASSAKTAYRPDVPCETQEPPDLRALTGSPPTQSSASALAAARPDPAIARLEERITEMLSSYAGAAELDADDRERAAKRAEHEALDLQTTLIEGPLARLAERLGYPGQGVTP